jgi:hypothetical protein
MSLGGRELFASAAGVPPRTSVHHPDTVSMIARGRVGPKNMGNSKASIAVAIEAEEQWESNRK